MGGTPDERAPSLLTAFDVESIHRQAAMAKHLWAPGLHRGVDAHVFFARVLGHPGRHTGEAAEAVRRTAHRGLPLDGLLLARGGRSTAIVMTTSVGPVVAQFPGEHYRTRGPVLAPPEILSTPDALRYVNAQRPGLAATLLHAEGESLIVTGYVSGIHAATAAGEDVNHTARTHLLKELPRALARLSTVEVPLSARRHHKIDSVVSVLDRAAHVRAARYPDGGPRLAEFGLTPHVFSELRRAAQTFTPRRTGILHNDIHYENVLVQFDAHRAHPRGIKLLDLQELSEGDPIQDLAQAGVKLACTPDEMTEFVTRWKGETQIHSAGVEEDLPAAMAAYGTSAATTWIPNTDRQIQHAAQHDRSSLPRVIASGAARIAMSISPVLTWIGESAPTRRSIERRLEQAIPHNPAFAAMSGLQPANAPQPRAELASAPDSVAAPPPRHVTQAKRATEKSLSRTRTIGK